MVYKYRSIKDMSIFIRQITIWRYKQVIIIFIRQETYDKSDGSDIKRIVYVKVHASQECLFEYAERLQMKKLLKVSFAFDAFSSESNVELPK